jgi:hypothetical protein
MNEYSININSICGKNIVTRDDGKKVHDLIIQQWNESTRIKIDFGNVLIASVSFMDEIFGKLAFEYDRQEVVSKLQMENIQDFDRALLNDILVSRYKQKELDQKGVSITNR